MESFKCSGCSNLRNDCDKVGQVCYTCSRSGISKPQNIARNQTAVGTHVKLPCGSCRTFIGPKDGAMMRDGTVFCTLCLNTGKYLRTKKNQPYLEKGQQEDYTGGKKPRARFGK